MFSPCFKNRFVTKYFTVEIYLIIRVSLDVQRKDNFQYFNKLNLASYFPDIIKATNLIEGSNETTN